MRTPPIRTITLGIADQHPLATHVILGAAGVLQRASTRYAEAGYEVQTVRLSTRPIFDDLHDWSVGALIDYARGLQHMLDDVGVGFCSLGTAQASRPDFPLERIELIADLLAPSTPLNATLQLATTEIAVRAQPPLLAARWLQ